jgi:hypothetical protein
VKKPMGRRQTPKQVRQLIFRMVAENTTWGAPRLHGELLMLGFDISERTISRWMKQAPRDSEPAKRWRAFLKNHREAIARRLRDDHDNGLLASSSLSSYPAPRPAVDRCRIL